MPNIPILLRKGSTEVWQELNPILEKNEPGLEKETNQVKIGDGEHHWNELPYFYGDFKITKTKKGTYITFLEDIDINLTNVNTTLIPEIIIQNVEELTPQTTVIETPTEDLKTLLKKQKRRKKKKG